MYKNKYYDVNIKYFTELLTENESMKKEFEVIKKKSEEVDSMKQELEEMKKTFKKMKIKKRIFLKNMTR